MAEPCRMNWCRGERDLLTAIVQHEMSVYLIDNAVCGNGSLIGRDVACYRYTVDTAIISPQVTLLGYVAAYGGSYYSYHQSTGSGKGFVICIST